MNVIGIAAGGGGDVQGITARRRTSQLDTGVTGQKFNSCPVDFLCFAR